jgi:Mg-chelatase subunit ChlD
LKTFTNFLLENRPRANQTRLWGTPEQPLQAVKDAVQAMINVIEALDSMDHVSLEVFAQTSRHEVNLTDNLQLVPTRLNGRQAAHYDSVTNIAGGMNQAIIELTSTRARSAAKKVMVLMSDGKPNVDSNGDYAGEDSPVVIQWCLDVAQNAANAGIQIYTVSVGGDADPELMAQIAEITGGQHFHAEGTPEEYRDQLEMIFRTLGGRRPVALIQ